MRKFIVASVILILVPLFSYASEPMTVTEPGDLNVTVFITDSPEFIKEWVETPPSHGPTIRRIKEAKYNQMVHAGFSITGFSKDSDSKVDFVVAVQVKAPDGTVLMQENQWAVHTKKVLIDKGVIIADPVLDMTFEPSDPAGSYKISAIVFDKISKKKAKGSVYLLIK